MYHDLTPKLEIITLERCEWLVAIMAVVLIGPEATRLQGVSVSLYVRQEIIRRLLFALLGCWWVWNVVEGEEQADGDWLFFGLVEGFESEWGYFTLSEFKELDWPKGIGVTLI